MSHLVKLGDVCDYTRGLTYKKKDEVEHSENAVLRANNVDRERGTLDLSDIKYINEDIEIPSTKKVRKGTLLICTASGSKRHLGKVALIDEDLDFAFGGFLGLLEPHEILDPAYLHWFLQSDFYRDFIAELSDGVNINNLKFSQLSELSLPLPPLAEQKRIVSILDEAFGAIAKAKENAERNLANARELFESYLNKVFTEKGEGWEETTVSDVCETLHQGLNTAGQKIKFYDSGFPIIQTRNIKNGEIDLHEKIKFMSKEDWLLYKEKYRPEVGDVFFTNIGTIGKTAIVSSSADYLIHWNIFKLRPQRGTILPEFLRYALDYLTKTGVFKRLQKGGTVEFVTKKMISNATFLLPKLSEQREIVSKLEVWLKHSEKLASVTQQKIADLDELKQSILQKAFPGQLPSKSPELESI